MILISQVVDLSPLESWSMVSLELKFTLGMLFNTAGDGMELVYGSLGGKYI